MGESRERPGAVKRLFNLLVICAAGFLFFQLISIPLEWERQAVLGGIVILIGFMANRASASRVATIALMLISMTATFRYGWWRIHMLVVFFADGENRHVSLDAALLLLLISAEVYTIVIMVLGYMQTAWPLQRKPIPLPADDTEWPAVDLLIPTYNEPLSLVRYTALAALNIDYPPDKLHVYILDDGTREEFSEFAAEAGVGYIIRKDHGHAKAGNINHALTMMSSPYVAIFDCDHVPTRSFLQMTVGWMLADARLGMLQTPHHFYSPDPFERNLQQYKTIPNESQLFYGIVQDGNDFWNATFFCGSCALIRRSALDEVGGIATETVTEDAHTSLRMQRRGYNTAYINIPQAAGLATESLAAHVGQRIRWARGMIQILRTENPLFGSGLRLSQRLCYFNAMMHFMYAVPRLVFLLSPLAFLLLGRTIIPGYWVAILAYAFPHLILASLTNSRVQGRHRHSFWNEIYESVLAPYILAPTLLALINPKLGKFNVTSKGSTLDKTQFDKKIATPTRWMLGLNFCGLLAVPYRLFVTDPQHPGAVVMNMVWVIFNIVILGVAAAVALEQKQRRGSVRIGAALPIQITAAGGRRYETLTVDMSVGGASIKYPKSAKIEKDDVVKVAFPTNTGSDEITARVVGADSELLRIAFQLNTISEQEVLTRALYSRADAWIESANLKEVDRPLVSLGRVIVLSTFGIRQVLRSLIPDRKRSARAGQVKTAGIVLALVFLGNSAPAPAAQQEINPPAEPGNTQITSLKDMGINGALEMRGPRSYSEVHFTLAHQLVPKEGVLHLAYSLDPAVDAASTSLHVFLNGTDIGTPPLTTSPGGGGMARIDLPVSGWLLVRSNALAFEFKGSRGMTTEESARSRTLCRIFGSTTFEVTGEWLRLGSDLGQLPLPIFDNELQTSTTVPFVFLTPPTPVMLEAAGVLASWLGLLSGSAPVRFVVSSTDIPPGNVIILSSNRSDLPATLQVPAGTGEVLALRTNPVDSSGSALILSGEDADGVLRMAQAVALMPRSSPGQPARVSVFSGDTVESPALVMPPKRQEDDAPRWLPVRNDAPLTNCQESALQTDGSSPIPVYFHTPPDLFYGEKEWVRLKLKYRYDAQLVAAGSALRVTLNGTLIKEIPLPPGSGPVDGERMVLMPVREMRPFGNTALFSFDFVPANRDWGSSPRLSGEILCQSTLDLHTLSRWAEMPNLQLFANAGFPFTQFADLSHTVVVMPAKPSASEISLYLRLMSYFGLQTGYPSLGVTVTGPGSTIAPDRDYLVLGTMADQPGFQSLGALLPAEFDGVSLRMKPVNGLKANLAFVQKITARKFPLLFGETVSDFNPAAVGTSADAVIQEIRSPASRDRSIVTIVLSQESAANEVSDLLLDSSRSSEMAGGLVTVRNSTFSSFQTSAEAYHLGEVSWFALVRKYAVRYYLLLLVLLVSIHFLCARIVYGWMRRHARERLMASEDDEVGESSTP
ncbi:UDP-forming cellulose synthase catalytic subunit [Acidobacteria bacterium AB60]|nr:UDP-forming cellulose synthase catalytic subunit [Acidobacteria bacterium AB60]